MPDEIGRTGKRPTGKRPTSHWRRYALIGYGALLVASHVTRLFLPDPSPRPDQHVARVHAIDGTTVLERQIDLAYSDLPAAHADAPVLVLLHGSPMASRSMMPLATALHGKYRVIVPDLPGMGRSTRCVPDYSIRAHALYLIQLLDTLDVQRVHLIGYSLGSGVALEMQQNASSRVASIVMVSGIGVQELELLSAYPLNHTIHGLQLAFFWLLEEGFPHFGFLDDAILNTAYARNFFDTDQRPLRGILESYPGPMLIIHGREDLQVPLAAAKEHARIVPQSELVVFDGGHELVFMRPDTVAIRIDAFVQRVSQGHARTRTTAEPERVAAAARPFDPADIPRAEGLSLVVLLLLISLATLVSEDLTCIGAGFLVAHGTISFLPATLACLLGIFFGDVLLFLAGRFVGRAVVRRAPLRWIVSGDDLAQGEMWLDRRGPAVIVASRFVPGTRLPTYVAAGLLQTNFWRFTFYFLLASIVWTPLLVGLAALLGRQALPLLSVYQEYALPVLVGMLAVLWLGVKMIPPLFSHRGRRLLLSSWRRTVRWEFWPVWFFYLPVLPYIGYLAIRHRSLALFTAVNPAMPAGGFVGESKTDILENLRHADDRVARFAVIEPDEDVRRRAALLVDFMTDSGLDFPVVLKPDVGERGVGVSVVRSSTEVLDYFGEHPMRTLAQEYVPGHEFGVFYYRYPGEERGHIFSITDKRFPAVTGDGKRTLERLILDDNRAVCMARFLLAQHRDHILEVPADGECVRLVELGTHCRGAVFLDGDALKTPALEAAIDGVSKGYPGFYFGRYDIRTPSVEDFRQGRNFRIVELNGVTSEATHIYDPGNRLRDAYRVLRRQWRIAFEIADENVQRGAAPVRLRHLARLILEHSRPASAKSGDRGNNDIQSTNL